MYTLLLHTSYINNHSEIQFNLSFSQVFVVLQEGLSDVDIERVPWIDVSDEVSLLQESLESIGSLSTHTSLRR